MRHYYIIFAVDFCIQENFTSLLERKELVVTSN